MPEFVSKSEWIVGGERVLGSINRQHYTDGLVMDTKIVEICEPKLTYGWEHVCSAPPVNYSSRKDRLIVHPITEDDTVFVKWVSDFSCDVDEKAIIDLKSQKLAMMKAFRKAVEKHLQLNEPIIDQA